MTNECLDNKDVMWCMNILDDVSRTFAVPIKMIEKPRSVYVSVGYLLCRISDTIEDSPSIQIDKKNELFDIYKKAVLNPTNEDVLNLFIDECKKCMPENPEEPSHWKLVVNADRLFNVYSNFDDNIIQCIQDPVVEMIEGMKEFCNKYPDGMRLNSYDELEEYCYYVAGTVGNMLSNIAIYENNIEENQKIRIKAQKYGSLLQHVNITKDVYEDYIKENNIYIPKEELDSHDIVQDSFIESDDSNLVITDMIDRTKNKINSARDYLEILSKYEKTNTRSWSIPYLLAVATLRELEDNTEKVLNGDVKIERDEVYSIIEEVRNSDYQRIIKLEEKIKDEPLHKVIS